MNLKPEVSDIIYYQARLYTGVIRAFNMLSPGTHIFVGTMENCDELYRNFLNKYNGDEIEVVTESTITDSVELLQAIKTDISEIQTRPVAYIISETNEITKTEEFWQLDCINILYEIFDGIKDVVTSSSPKLFGSGRDLSNLINNRCSYLNSIHERAGVNLIIGSDYETITDFISAVMSDEYHDYKRYTMLGMSDECPIDVTESKLDIHTSSIDLSTIVKCLTELITGPELTTKYRGKDLITTDVYMARNSKVYIFIPEDPILGITNDVDDTIRVDVVKLLSSDDKLESTTNGAVHELVRIIHETLLSDINLMKTIFDNGVSISIIMTGKTFSEHSEIFEMTDRRMSILKTEVR